MKNNKTSLRDKIFRVLGGILGSSFIIANLITLNMDYLAISIVSIIFGVLLLMYSATGKSAFKGFAK